MGWFEFLDNNPNPGMQRQQMSFHVREAQKAAYEMGIMLSQLAATQPHLSQQFSQLQQLNARVGDLLQQVQKQLDPPQS
ncbi:MULTISPECIES: hypothetical protein [Desulfofundulus]|uniref:Uncharacterized protein n=1 Tax=Desulfofundulus australicus DSM 11792 TaxID=1121425 RepID=A0A1M5DBK9_9FIRM|nr:MULTISPECIES: hypothetical protein [Desulfofundulus]MBE3585811.1 hypothetical protein [Thermoanaerobacter sp.]MCS5696397.1 hypothetical protein [Desulfofundulus thermocisternus]SHF64244.1 hypothetical protein SAMN02745218_02775 [Desulfofundulus australicus DSM 11792]